MVEIAISLAIIGFALVAIIGILPIGMRVQRDNRERTIINQEATVFLDALRGGARGLDDLTNYVYAITNYRTAYPALSTSVNGYTYAVSTTPPFSLNSGARIVGLLSTPEYTDLAGNPTNNLFSGGFSNHVVAYVRSINGPAVEKPPQANDSIIRQDSFSYRILCVNAPAAVDTNVFFLNAADPRRIYTDRLSASLHELRLAFLWPQLPNGSLGTGRQNYRATIAGQLVATNDLGGQALYFYQAQTFASTTNAP